MSMQPLPSRAPLTPNSTRMDIDMWECERYQWARLRSSTSAARLPDAIDLLTKATTPEEAEAAYWRIDNEVVVQGALYEAALPAMRCLVVGLARCSAAGRPRLLELLFQLANGESHPSEVALGNAGIGPACRGELGAALGAILSMLEQARPDENGHCVDLLMVCASHDATLAPRLAWYLRRALSASLPAALRSMIIGWLGEQGEPPGAT